MSASTVKCVIWDLDGTVWDGILAERDALVLRPAALTLVQRLERAGIVQSVASKNERGEALEMLRSLGIAELFVHSQISWSAKSASVRRIIERLNIGEDAVVFLDDSAFERAEVKHALPSVRALSLDDFHELDRSVGLVPDKVTAEARRRPAAYREEASRQAAAEAFEGTSAEFLASLEMALTVRPATNEDLERGAELTERTNQLNTTGRSYSIAALRRYREQAGRRFLIAELEDRFGSYGRIGLCLLRREPGGWLIELLLTSCRVAGRNIGNALIAVAAQTAADDELALRALFRENARNRQMRITYRFLGFERVAERNDTIIYEHVNPAAITAPDYIELRAS